MDTQLLIASARNAVGAGIYIFAVSQFMNHAEKLLGNIENSFLAPFAFLLLLTASVAIVGSLIFGQAVILFLDNKKRESIKAAIYSVLSLFVITALVIGTLIVIN